MPSRNEFSLKNFNSRELWKINRWLAGEMKIMWELSKTFLGDWEVINRMIVHSLRLGFFNPNHRGCFVLINRLALIALWISLIKLRATTKKTSIKRVNLIHIEV